MDPLHATSSAKHAQVTPRASDGATCPLAAGTPAALGPINVCALVALIGTGIAAADDMSAVVSSLRHKKHFNIEVIAGERRFVVNFSYLFRNKECIQGVQIPELKLQAPVLFECKTATCPMTMSWPL